MSPMPSVITTFIDYYTEMGTQQPSMLVAIYHPEIELTDPFGKHQGLFALEQYFTNLLTNVKHCNFSVDSPICQGKRVAVHWVMNWSHPRIARGETLQLPGCSIIELKDNLIIRQYDYYDAGEMLYQHLPVLGWMIRKVKQRVRS